MLIEQLFEITCAYVAVWLSVSRWTSMLSFHRTLHTSEKGMITVDRHQLDIRPATRK
jgi:hypothetical protein